MKRRRPRAAPRSASAARWWWIGGAILLALHLVLVWLMVSRSLDPLFNDTRHRLGPGTDFATYYEAGREWNAGRTVFGDGPAFGYRYHPLLAMTVGATLARIPFTPAYVAWMILFEILLLADLVVFHRIMGATRRFAGLVVLLLLFSPYYLELYMGNASFLAASLLLLAWFADRRGQRTVFVALFAASILVKPIGLVLLPLLLVHRRFGEAALIAGIVAVLAVPYFVSRPDDLGMVFAVNTLGRSPGWLVHAGNQGLHGFFGTLLTRWSGIPTGSLASYGQLPGAARGLLAVLPLGLALVSLRTSWLTRDRIEVGIFMWSCVYLMGYHDVWEHSHAMLVLGLGLLWTVDFVPRRILVPCSIGLAAPTAFALYDVPLPPGPYDPEHQWSAAVSLLHHATKPAWLLALYLACVWQAERARRAGRAGPGAGRLA